MKFNDRLTHDFLEIFKKSYVIKKYVYDFETKNNTNHKPLFVVCDYITNCVCDFETRFVISKRAHWLTICFFQKNQTKVGQGQAPKFRSQPGPAGYGSPT